MQTLLISANTEKINMPTLPMGLGSVAVALEAAGHAVGFVDLMAVDDQQSVLRTELLQKPPDVFGISI